MKKVLSLALLGFSIAQAQTWTVDGPFKDEFLGCARISSGQVQCAMRSSYTGSGSTYFGATYFARDSAAYAPDRKRYLGSASSVGGRDTTNTPINVSKASPVTVIYTFDYPREFSTIALLFLDTGMMKDVTIQATTPVAAAPTPAAPPRAVTTTPVPNAAPAPRTAPAPAPSTINLSTFDIRLTGCTQTAQGGFTCTRAELLPRP